ncbi:ankyrin repeat and SOCS box protein 3 [Patella vulgata]|uniref:ankyrin repeat and SOCS box protein 3 n=1 Tax=Patella vulgata TaxID=6465 RepID=UPI00217FFD1B|nr:ankyrin repeat and SOCS box protein 3 [Patella vulgata]
MDFTEAYPDSCSTVGSAARAGDLIDLQELVWHGRPVDVKDNRGWTPLHDAAFHGNPGCLEFLLRQEAVDVNWQTFEGETALLLAARQGHRSCVHTLLCTNADVNMATNEGFTPLWEAVNYGSIDCVKLLIKREADVDCMVYTGYRPIHAAAEKGFAHILYLLLQNDAQIDVYTENKLSPLFLAAHTGHVECLKLILTEMNDNEKDIVNVAAFDNATPLLIAAQEGHSECVRLLLSYGADGNIAVSENGGVPLQYAIYKGHYSCVEHLLPVTNIAPILENTTELHPLINALHLPDTKILRLLLMNGVDPHMSFPLHSDQTDLDRLTSIFSPLTHGSVLCQLQTDCPIGGIKLLIEAGLSPNSRHPKEMPPLMAALWKGSYALCILLLRSGANPNIYLHNSDGNLAMILAARAGLKDCPMDNVDVVERSIFIWALFMAGAESESLFNITSGDSVNHINDNMLFTLFRKSNYQLVLFMVSLLLCLSHDVTLDKAILEIFTFEDKKNIKCLEESTHRLSHMCRRKIVKDLGSKGKYTESRIQSFLLPRTVQDYLLFKEYGNLGGYILQLNNQWKNFQL